MTKALPDPPVDCLAVNEHLSFERRPALHRPPDPQRLGHRAGLRRPPAPHDRAKIHAVWHLLEMAKTVVDRSIDCTPRTS